MEPEFEIPLPNDLLAEIIFKFIPMCHWSSRLEPVSEQFQSAVKKAYHRIKSINIRKLYSLRRQMKNRGKNGHEETATSQRLNNILNKLTTLCPKLTEVTGFEHTACNVDAETLNILKKFSLLKSISISGFQGSAIPFERFADFVVSKEIKFLSISGSCFDVNVTLNVGSLESIAIYQRSSHGNAILKNLSENLTTLKMRSFDSAFQSPSKAEQEMSMCRNLKCFSLGINTMGDYEMFFKILPNLRNLTSLSVTSNTPASFVFLFDTHLCNRLDFLKNQLQVIHISGVNLSREAQIFLFSNCPRLETLHLRWLILPFSASALQNLSSLPDELKMLTFPDPGGQIFPILMPKLVKLKIFNDLTIYDDGPDSYCEEWENICCLVNLQHLCLSGVNDALLEKWDKKNGKMFEKLISLRILCPRVTDVGACLLAKKATNMQNLHLLSCRISDKSIAAFGEFAKKLTSVSFVQRDSYLFDENAILHFIKKSFNLKKLQIYINLAEKVVQHVDFLPFVEDVEISGVII